MKRNLLLRCLLLCSIISLSGCSNYGQRIGINDKSEVYIIKDATADEGRKLGEFLLTNGFFDTENNKRVQLQKEDDAYTIRFVVDPLKLKNNERAQLGFQVMQMIIKDSVFGGRPVKVLLTNEAFESFETVQPFPK